MEKGRISQYLLLYHEYKPSAKGEISETPTKPFISGRQIISDSSQLQLNSSNVHFYTVEKNMITVNGK